MMSCACYLPTSSFLNSQYYWIHNARPNTLVQINSSVVMSYELTEMQLGSLGKVNFYRALWSGSTKQYLVGYVSPLLIS